MSPSVEGAIRPIEGTDRVEQLRAGRWWPLKMWRVGAEGQGDFRLLPPDRAPPDGAFLEVDPGARLQEFAVRARRAIDSWQLSETSMRLLEVLCLLEPLDRWRWFLEAMLPVIWGSMQHAEERESLDVVLERLSKQQLVDVKAGSDDLGVVQYYTISDTVAWLVLQGMDPNHKHPILLEVSKAWTSRFVHDETAPDKHTVRAGIGAAMYLLRLSQPHTAFELLHARVLPVASRTGESAPVIEHMRQIVAMTGDQHLRAQLEAVAPTST